VRLHGFGSSLDDPCDALHGVRVARFADALGSCLGWEDARLEAIRLAAVVHDIGKLSISQAVLRKPGTLTREELAQVRLHPSVGAWIASPVLSLRAVLPCILLHHERWDGDGYPTGRRRTAIPLEARLLAVVDAFDAMISDRPYRRAMPVACALDELERGAGTQFDPALAEAFVEAWRGGALLAREQPRLRASTVFA